MLLQLWGEGVFRPVVQKSLFPEQGKNQFSRTTSKFIDKEASWFENNLEVKWISFIESLCRPFLNHFNLSASVSWKVNTEGEMSDYHEKRSFDIFEE